MATTLETIRYEEEKKQKREQEIREEKNRLLSLSEKELFVELILELKRMENRIDDASGDIYSGLNMVRLR